MIPVHLTGQPCDMEEIVNYPEYKFKIIEGIVQLVQNIKTKLETASIVMS